MLNFTGEAHYFPDEFREIIDLNVHTRSYVDDLSDILIVIFLHEKEASICKIIYIQEFPIRFSRTPENDRFRFSRTLCLNPSLVLLHPQFGLMKFPYQRGQHMRRLQIEMIAGSIQICRHDRDEI